jgi:hypothetical protein
VSEEPSSFSAGPCGAPPTADCLEEEEHWSVSREGSVFLGWPALCAGAGDLNLVNLLNLQRVHWA